jgi:hypothetical protein
MRGSMTVIASRTSRNARLGELGVREAYRVETRAAEHQVELRGAENERVDFPARASLR